MVASTEIDVRLFGMVVALAVIWIGFHLLSGGDFLTARNLWNLSVQSASIAIMATGMVLIIVSRNIDLSVGSLLGFLGYTMAMVQTEWIPNSLGLGFDRWYTWILALARRPRLRCRDRGRPGLHRLVHRGALVHRHARRVPRLAGPDLPLPAGPDAGPARQDVPAARRGHARLARRVEELAARRAGVCRHRLQHRGGPAPPSALPLRAASARRRHRARRARWSLRARRGLGRQQLPVAAAARQGVRRRPRHRRAARWSEDPDRRGVPGRDHDRRRPR